MAVDAVVFADEQNGVVVSIPVTTPTNVDAAMFTDGKTNSGVTIDKKEGQKNSVFLS